jgi:hypothetical protein
MPADRVIPDRVGEVYYLKYNPNHRWSGSPVPRCKARVDRLTAFRRYWLEKQTSSEPFVFVMYDTKAGKHARCECICTWTWECYHPCATSN